MSWVLLISTKKIFVGAFGEKFELCPVEPGLKLKQKHMDLKMLLKVGQVLSGNSLGPYLSERFVYTLWESKKLILSTSCTSYIPLEITLFLCTIADSAIVLNVFWHHNVISMHAPHISSANGFTRFWQSADSLNTIGASLALIDFSRI